MNQRKNLSLTVLTLSLLASSSFVNASISKKADAPDTIAINIQDQKPLTINELDWSDPTQKIKKKVKTELLKEQKFSANIYDVEVVKTADKSTELRINFNGFPTTPKAKKTENPSQLFLNFGEVGIELEKQIHSVATDQIKSFDLARNDQNEVILSLNLTDNFGRFTTKRDDGAFVLKIYPSLLKSAVNQQAESLGNGLQSLDFNRTKGGEDQLILDLANSTTPVVVDQKGSKLFIRFKGNKIPTKLLGSKSFNDVKAVISHAKIYNEGFNGVVELDINGSYTYMAYQVDKKLTLNIASKGGVATTNAKASNKLANASSYSGRPISLDLQNVDVRKILQILANYTNSNIVASDNVKGEISVRLQDVPWDQALNIILKTKGLSQRKDGNVIWVAPSTELSKYEEDEAKAYANSVTLAPLVTSFVQLNFATASNVVGLIRMQQGSSTSATKSNLTAQQVEISGAPTNSLLSPRGSVSYDERTNTVIINDTAQKISEIKRVISEIDVPVRQVLVEARIVRATTNFARNLGVKWAIAKDGSNPLNSNLSNLYQSSNYYKAQSGDSSSSSSSTSTENNVAIDLGQNLGAGIAFGLINTTDQLLGLELSALQSDGQGEILSSPKVMTGDKQQASIRSGVRLPYQTANDNFGTTTSFQDAVLELIVTPSITPDGTVQMNLVINKDTQGQLTDAGYAIDTNQLTTNVLVDDGETVVLGGLYEETNLNGVEKVPLLGDIPVVGNLFKSNSKSTQKQELLIFITPKIVKKTK